MLKFNYKLIDERRKALGWNLKVTAERCELCSSVLTHYRKGNRTPNGEALAKLAHGLKIYDLREWFTMT